MDTSTLGGRIKAARTAKGPIWTQGHLAVAAGVAKATIGMLERGERGISDRGSVPGSIPAIAKALGVTYDWLAFGTGPMAADDVVARLGVLLPAPTQTPPAADVPTTTTTTTTVPPNKTGYVGSAYAQVLAQVFDSLVRDDTAARAVALADLIGRLQELVLRDSAPAETPEPAALRAKQPS